MRFILRDVETERQRPVDTYAHTCLPYGMPGTDKRGHRIPPPQPLEERQQLGQRLAGARALAGFTLESAAKALTERGYPISKGGLGHWETGKNLPDALWLRRLAKLYGSTLDALVWDEAISMEAIQFAVQYDALSERQKRTFRAMWIAYFEQAKTDAEVEEHLPPAPASTRTADEIIKDARIPSPAEKKTHKKSA